MTSVFLSYARGDDVEPSDPATSFAARLYRDLTAAGFDVWFDRVKMPSRGLTFHQEIRDAISARDRLLLIVGPKAVASDDVRQEWQFAWFDAEKVVTPILRSGDDPLVIPELALLHAEDFREDSQYDRHLQELIRILRDPAPRMGQLIGVPSLPAHYLSRSDLLTPLRDAVRAGLDSTAPLGGTAVHQKLPGIIGRQQMGGMAGIGKSVLACLLAHDRKVREAFPDGIVWVALGSLPNVSADGQLTPRRGASSLPSVHEGDFHVWQHVGRPVYRRTQRHLRRRETSHVGPAQDGESRHVRRTHDGLRGTSGRNRLRAEAKLADEMGFAANYVDSVPIFDRPGVRFPYQAHFHPLRYLEPVQELRRVL